ncbi:acyl-CoA dehydrogenase family protein [Microbacterium betulae]|uniref:Acyl-CoA dehydrogenase family protein n=1 Tax=Microbacterium betulae TaxID=2981139 RepID=A0AA97FIS7_9MICO|nr:acyl-CoA dehydrogenase family protein [Microbacterium sp. AB]WOF22794.1 acyl-CoA dehydrogenase family protein [Microbacterium sp. AB]
MSQFVEQRWEGVPEDVVRRIRPVVEQIAEGAAERERERRLPVAEVDLLRDAGLTLARVPASEGGWGLGWRPLARVLIAVAAADANLPQILRGHLALVEQTITTADAAFRDRWLQRLRAGAVVGNAWSEPAGKSLARSGTEIVAGADGGLRVTGRKFYTTGSIFGTWTDALASRAEDDAEVAALIPLDQEGVTVLDDWDGFGQRLTGTGTILFEEATVDAEDVLPVAERFGYQTAQFQLVLLTVLAGIAQDAVADAAARVRTRTRVYSHGLAGRAQDDAQIQALIGELAAEAFAVEATVLAVADAVESAYAALVAARDGAASAEDARTAAGLAEIRAAQAQSVVTAQVQRIASRLFDALGASATARDGGLDRHWRNARTVSSHNPVLYKNRWVGEWVLSDVLPDPLWSVGTPEAASGSPDAG